MSFDSQGNDWGIGGYNPITGSYDSTNGGLVSGGNGGGLFGGFSNILNAAGNVFGTVWNAVNGPNQTVIPGGGILQNGQVYYPSAMAAGGNSSLFMILIFGGIAYLLLRK